MALLGEEAQAAIDKIAERAGATPDQIQTAAQGLLAELGETIAVAIKLAQACG